MVIFAAVVAAIAAFVMVLLVTVYFQHLRRMSIFYRLRRHHVIESGQVLEQPYLERMRGWLRKAAAPLSEHGPIQVLDFRMRQAGIPLLGGEFMIMLLVSALAAFLGSWMLTLETGTALLIAAMTVILLWLTVSWRIYSRRNAFSEQLGDCLTTISNALRAGYSFPQAVEVVAKEMEPPISDEFAQVYREVGMGVPLEAALEAMGRRVGSADLDLVINAVLIQREVGGNLAQILDNISDTIQERIRMKREIFALTAQGRLSAWVLIILPFALALFMYFFNREQLMVLIEDPLGRMALLISLLLEVIGYVVIQKIVHIDV
ncbi:MAG: type II secretion system F family protein [Selenomonas sp.]|nr:type II secretion system F family protein [Selenomonas sp.]MBQ1460783.1 type II secretion system F family protein [Selenomonas sp.]MBQ2137083.1 type II secretion system F family protein [Selenomonas sp.]MBQ4212565.1 type II secretion system F family protein [Selenomonas sp.]